MIKDDVLLNEDVVELKDEPAVDSCRIAIAVNDGVVTLRRRRRWPDGRWPA